MRAQLTEYYVLVETDDIDFSALRLAVETIQTEQAEAIESLPVEILEEL